MTTIYVAGIAQVIIGIQTLLWVPAYSCYSDQATLPVALLTFLLCVFTHKMCLLFGRLTGIWKIDEVIEKFTDSAQGSSDFHYLVNKVITLA